MPPPSNLPFLYSPLSPPTLHLICSAREEIIRVSTPQRHFPILVMQKNTCTLTNILSISHQQRGVCPKQHLFPPDYEKRSTRSHHQENAAYRSIKKEKHKGGAQDERTNIYLHTTCAINLTTYYRFFVLNAFGWNTHTPLANLSRARRRG